MVSPRLNFRRRVSDQFATATMYRAVTPDPTACGAKKCVNGKDFNASKHYALNKSQPVSGEAAMMEEVRIRFGERRAN